MEAGQTCALTVVSWVSTHAYECLNIACDFHPHINCIHLYGSCYIDPLKFGTHSWVLAKE